MFLQQFIISLDKDFLWIFFVIYNSRNLDISYYNLKIIKDRIYNSRNLDISLDLRNNLYFGFVDLQ